MRPHNPELCDYLVLEVQPEGGTRSVMLGDPHVPEASDNFDSHDTVRDPVVTLGYWVGRRPFTGRAR